MPAKGPHISIEHESLVPRILKIGEREFSNWPSAVRKLAIEIASELFLVRYNPFIDEDTVKKSVGERFDLARRSLDHHYATSIGEGITMFWSAHDGDMAFRDEIISKLSAFLPAENIDTRNSSLIDNATDATDLRLELPLLVVTPSTVGQITAIVKLANEMQFALIPRGGGSGLTGGAVPARKRSVILAMTKFTQICEVDPENMTITAQAGVITSDAIKAAAGKGLLFSVDPASKTASSIGGNIAENAGGPLCFEYGTTIDNLLSYHMVTPEGEYIEVARINHPRHKILPDEESVFEVRSESGEVIKTIRIPGSELRTPGLGKDVTNKALHGLPGMQKEGTDGIIVDGTFILHPTLKHYRVMVLEFFGRSMENSMLVINDIVALRNDIRTRGDLVKITALEEFNAKYVKAIVYKKKSSAYEGDPISVLLLQLDSDNETELTQSVQHIVQICNNYDGVDVFVAKDGKEAELFWEDRHKLSAIAKRTSGFKINEDVVIPMQSIPTFALFLEKINLEYMGRAYRDALRAAAELPGISEDESDLAAEFSYVNKVIHGEIHTQDVSDEELQLHAVLFLNSLSEKNPELADRIAAIVQRMENTCVCVASHMHAGDGNWHVNIPVHSNDAAMLKNAETVAHLVMAEAQRVGGEVTGEHGIGITKIAFFTPEKMEKFRQFKQEADPRNIFNPAKLTQRDLPVSPFTFSFNHLIEDIRQSGLANKEVLMELLANIQICTRCGKCKQHCPMHYPEQSLLYHPRNKNLVLGALIEAIYYFQANHGKPDTSLYAELRKLVEHCTGCGKCLTVCPVKIKSPDVALALRSFLDERGAGGHPIKSLALKTLAKDPTGRIPKVAKLAAIGQGMQNKFLKLVPESLRSRFSSPMFSGPGPQPGYKNIFEILRLDKSSIFVPVLPEGEKVKGTVFYFPGCGGGIFFSQISLAGIVMLLQTGYAVVLPDKHICCGYALLAAGSKKLFEQNMEATAQKMRALAINALGKGYPITHVLTACGSCRDSMQRYGAAELFAKISGSAIANEVALDDVGNFLMSNLAPATDAQASGILYHSPCHTEVAGMHKIKAPGIYAQKLAAQSGAKVSISRGCCGESGLGAMTSPYIYNKLRQKKTEILRHDLAPLAESAPIVVSCPSCRMGITRIMLKEKSKRPVLHTLEYLAERRSGPRWKRFYRKLLQSAPLNNGVRMVSLDALGPIMAAKDTDNGDDD